MKTNYVEMKRFVLLLFQLLIWTPVFALVLTLITAVVVIIGCLLGGERFFSFYPCVIWSRLTCMISLCPIKVIGREKLNKKQSYIFVANHQGFFDVFLMFSLIGQPIKWVMKKNLQYIPLVGLACRAAGYIFVDKKSPQSAAKTIKQAEKKLKNGVSVVFFPEGSRTETGKMGVFKKGAFQMALDLKLPIVPVSINGSYEVMPIGTLRINPHKMEMIIHDPIQIEEINTDNIREVAIKVRELRDRSCNAIASALWDKYK